MNNQPAAISHFFAKIRRPETFDSAAVQFQVFVLTLSLAVPISFEQSASREEAVVWVVLLRLLARFLRPEPN
jgi:hypothetical protein